MEDEEWKRNIFSRKNTSPGMWLKYLRAQVGIERGGGLGFEF